MLSDASTGAITNTVGSCVISGLKKNLPDLSSLSAHLTHYIKILQNMQFKPYIFLKMSTYNIFTIFKNHCNIIHGLKIPLLVFQRTGIMIPVVEDQYFEMILTKGG